MKRYYYREIWTATMFLCSLGLIMIYSASGSMFYFERQLEFILLGCVACFIGQAFDYKILYKYALIIYIGSILCVFLLLTDAGVSVNGATRWLRVAGVSFQVAEAVKIGEIVLLSYMLHRHRYTKKHVGLLFLMWLIGGGAAGLLLVISNDLSSSIVVLGIAFTMTLIFTNTLKIHMLTLGIACGFSGLYVYSIWNNMPSGAELENLNFRVGRIAAWLDPFRYKSNQAYQSLQAFYAIGRGGTFGRGLGNSLQKFIIPEPHTDMIFAILCEELGLVGVGILFYLIGYLIYCLMKTVNISRDIFGSALVTGIIAHISIQSIINIAVCTGIFPNTGIALPFISYGGTAIFTLLCEIAIVLSVSKKSKEVL